MIFKCASSGSIGNCYSLTADNGKSLILDAGIPIAGIKKLVDWKVTDISSCFISHSHKDHLLSAHKIKNMGIPVFEPYLGGSQKFEKDGWKMSAFPLPHDDVENRGIFIICPDGHRMLYLTDFAYSPYSFQKQKVQTILIECNHMDEMEKGDNEGKFEHVLRGHSNLSVVKDFLKINQTEALKTVILCHLSTTNADADEMVRQVQEVVGDKVKVYVAERNMKIEL